MPFGGFGGVVQHTVYVIGKEALASGAADAIALRSQRVDLRAIGTYVQIIFHLLGKALTLVLAGLLCLTCISVLK